MRRIIPQETKRKRTRKVKLPLVNSDIKCIKKQIEDLIDFQKKNLNLLIELNKSLVHVQKKMGEYDARLVKITEINSFAEETFSNVLLAIRQNEFLQAYYPPQKGYPEMKVVGRHPCSTKKIEIN